MKQHFGLTIGPIFDTILQAKKTRAVWASSYLFSWLMKTILEELKKTDLLIVSPYTKEFYQSKYGAGLYADRAYFTYADETTGDNLITEAIEKTLNHLNDDVGKKLKVDKEETKQFLKAYFNFKVVGLNHTGPQDSFPLDEINQKLDQAELFKAFPLAIETNYLIDYLNIKSGTLITNTAFSEEGRNFLSLPEISASGLANQYPKDFEQVRKESFKNSANEEFEFMDSLRAKFSENFRPYHKYYGILNADADNISKILAKVKAKTEDLSAFSKALFDFNMKAEEIIKNYGGNGIYLGGDDVLAFLPMYNGEITVFDLIKALDEAFASTIIKFAETINVQVPSMSYSLMLAYYKHPLKESMQAAADLLHGTKNKISFCFQKHSGQKMDCVIEKKSLPYILEIMNTDHGKEKLLSGLMNRLNDDLYFDLYKEAVKNYSLNAFFDNFMNDQIHKENAFIDELKIFTEKVLKDYQDSKEAKKVIFCVLRYLHFIKTTKE
jgi:CRISPR-associated protein Cmr2